MIYLINIKNPGMYTEVYTLFETHTESTIEVTAEYIKTLINTYGMSIKNINIENEKIQIKKWPHDIKYYSVKRHNRTNYILLVKINNNRFKLVSHQGSVVYMTEKALKASIKDDAVINCEYIVIKEIDEEYGIAIETERSDYKSTDTYTIKEDTKFENFIALKYREFKAKSMIVGLNINFKYTIENGEVKLTHYSGESLKVIIPNFVSTICSGAFRYKGIVEIVLNDKLKYIGKSAFEGNMLQNVVIPESVQILYKSAFEGNKGHFYTGKSSLNTDNVKILNKNIKIL